MTSRLRIAIGQRFGDMVVLALIPERRRQIALCRCICGTTKEAIVSDLCRGRIVSCGCRKLARCMHISITHGHSRRITSKRSPTYWTWLAMMGRCYSIGPQHKDYKRYRGRGVLVDARWHTFTTFLADMGERPAGTSLDRIDPDGHYEPPNCRWASKEQQQSNKSRSTESQPYKSNHPVQRGGV